MELNAKLRHMQRDISVQKVYNLYYNTNNDNTGGEKW